MTRNKDISVIDKDDLQIQKRGNKARKLLDKYLINCKKIERYAIQNRRIMASIKRLERIVIDPEDKEI